MSLGASDAGGDTIVLARHEPIGSTALAGTTTTATFTNADLLVAEYLPCRHTGS